MEDLSVWYNGLSDTMRVFWICGGVSTLIFLIQFAMTFIGIGDTDADFDFSGGEGDTMDFGGMMSLFSVRNIVNFFMGFGWGGVCIGQYTDNKLFLYLGATIIGLIFVAIFFYLIKQLLKLESSGNIDMNDCVGKVCNVYLRIPAARSGKGKVQMSINGTIIEWDAITDDKDIISTGSQVKVIEVTGGSTLLVERV